MQLTIRMPDENMLKIEYIAKKMGLKKSDVARMAIKAFLDQHDEPSVERPYTKVENLLGIAESGLSDLGYSHREHLIEKIKGTQK